MNPTNSILPFPRITLMLPLHLVAAQNPSTSQRTTANTGPINKTRRPASQPCSKSRPAFQRLLLAGRTVVWRPMDATAAEAFADCTVRSAAAGTYEEARWWWPSITVQGHAGSHAMAVAAAASQPAKARSASQRAARKRRACSRVLVLAALCRGTDLNQNETCCAIVLLLIVGCVLKREWKKNLKQL